MNQSTYIKKFAIWTAVIISAIIAICGLLWGKVVEASAFEEVSKWVVCTLGIICIVVEPFVVCVIAPLCYHRKYDVKKDEQESQNP